MQDVRQIAVLRPRVAAWLATLLAGVIACALLAGSASAASYSVYSCTGPSGESVPNFAWVQRRSVPAHTAAFTFGSSCPDLSVVATSGTALAAGEDAGYAFDAPAGTTIAGYLVRRSINVTYPSSGTKPTLSAGLRRTSNGADSYWGECEAVAANCSVAAAGAQSVGMAASSLQLGVECAQSATSCAGAGISTLRTTLAEARVDLTDNSAPTLALTGGTLPGASGMSGIHSIDVSVNDVGGGIKGYALAVDGVKLYSSNLGGSCSQPFTQRVPCPSDAAVSYPVNLASYGPGTHTATVTATDAAGNVGTLAPVSFTVPGASSGGVTGLETNGKPSVGVPVLVTRKSLIDGKGGRAVSVRGVLKTSTGVAIAGAALEVTASSLGVSGAAIRVLGSAKTAADGSFSFKVRPNGARRVTFTFRPSSGAASTAEASTIVRQLLALSARRSQSVLRKGHALTISGKLAGTAGAANGAPVEIDVLAGKKWVAVGTVRATKSGSYKWKHRFTRVTRPTLFRFRAVVKSAQTWPWPSKSSNSIQVLVTG